MFPATAAPAPSITTSKQRPPDQPSGYCPVPQRLITELHDNPLAIGLYGFVARLYLVAQAPIPLSVPDVLRFDPTLSRGAVLRALARLVASGYVIETTQKGRKSRYTPTWGRVGGSPLAWNMAQACLGRPRHVARLRVDRRFFDICMGKLVPHATRAAVITRYITTPVVSLTDIGCYALTLVGVPRTTSALIRLGAIRNGAICPLPGDRQLLALISQRALDLGEDSDTRVELTSSGTRKLGVQPIRTPDSGAAQPLFFVPPELIGMVIDPMIGSMIASDGETVSSCSAAETDETRLGGEREGITWDSRDQLDEAILPPNPPAHQASGGGGDESFVPTARKPKQRQIVEPLPEIETVTALHKINVKPAQIRELAHLPLTTIEAAIADGRARPGVRDLAAWVVCLLRAHRDYNWKISPPAPPPDSPEALRAAFARYAMTQEVARGDEQHRELAEAPGGIGELPPHAVEEAALPSLVRIWNDVQAAIALRITRQEFKAWLAPTLLHAIENGIATISAPSVRLKMVLDQQYATLICDLLAVVLGYTVELRVTVPSPDPSNGVRDDTLRTYAAQEPQTPAPAPEPDRRPDWISAQCWMTLPVMLRIALVGSTLTDGAFQAASPYLSKLIHTRFRVEVARLIAAAQPEPGSNMEPKPAVER